MHDLICAERGGGSPSMGEVSERAHAFIPSAGREERVDDIQHAVLTPFQPTEHRQDPLTCLRGLPIQVVGHGPEG